MNIRTVKFEELSSDEIVAWSTIQRDHAEFASPFFRPEFTQLVSAVRDDVEIAVLEAGEAPIGFFPFQRSYFNAGQPVGSGVNDYQAVIARPELALDPLELLRECGLTSWRFDHLVPVQAAFARYAWSSADSAYIDLSEGFDTYLRNRENGTGIMADYRRKKKRIEREVGPLRFEPHVSDPAVLATCIQWKVEQLHRTGLVDIFNFPWTTKLLQSILAFQGENFAGSMPMCYAGDQIAAINFGMRSGDVFYSWFPTYNMQLANCSPGALHFVEMMQAAESLGIRRIILGKGEEAYKKRLMNGADSVAQGCVDLRPAVSTARRAWRQTRESIKASPLRSTAKVPARIVNRIATWLTFR
jgi:CelD/BcsL family acetyltransferase involved in cellulose biosynthesis